MIINTHRLVIANKIGQMLCMG